MPFPSKRLVGDTVRAEHKEWTLPPPHLAVVHAPHTLLGCRRRFELLKVQDLHSHIKQKRQAELRYAYAA
jgi:hypothetical protein